MRSDSGLGNIASKIIAAILSLLLLLFSLLGPLGVITRVYAGTGDLVETATPLIGTAIFTPTFTPPPPTFTPTVTPVPTTPTPTVTPTPPPTHTPTPTPTDTPTLTPTPGTVPGITPTPAITTTPQATGTTTAIPTTTTGPVQTPPSTATAVPVANNHGSNPPGSKTGGGSPIPFILITAGVLLILGMVSVVAFVLLRGSMSPVPQAKLRSDGVRPWSRWRGHSFHGNTNINGVPLVVEGERAATAYNGPFLPGPGGIVANNQPQVPFGNALPPANWRSGSAPTNIPQVPFSAAPPQSTMPQSSFLQQGPGPIRFRAGENTTAPNQQPFPTQNMQSPPRNAPSEEQLRRLAQQRLIVPPEEHQNEDWIR